MIILINTPPSLTILVVLVVLAVAAWPSSGVIAKTLLIAINNNSY